MNINVGCVCPNYDFEIHGASYIGEPADNTVMYIAKKVEHLLENLRNSISCLIYAECGIEISPQLKEKNCFIQTDNPQRDYARFVARLADARDCDNKRRRYRLTEKGYYIGENIRIGEGCIIEPMCFIGHDVVIGKNARIMSGAKIKNVIIGDNFIAGENCIIGTYGFTMAVDEENNKIRIPTLGRIVIGDNVEIGGLSNIAVGSAGNTVIEDNVKIDAHVHIGHDVKLHRNVEIPAGAVLGGFVELGERSYVGINATLRNRISVGENAVIGMGAVVTKSVADGITVVGNPAKPFIKNMKL